MGYRVLFAAAVAVTFLFTATASYAVDPVLKCQASLLKAWGKRRSCEYKTAAKAALAGEVADIAPCQTRWHQTWEKVGSSCRFLSMEPGTVTDLWTGLMWQKSDDNGGLTDKDNTYTWSDASGAPDGAAFDEFIAGLNFCQSGDVSCGYAGHTDWRMPQFGELFYIMDFGLCSSGVCIDQSAFGPTNPEFYWSATTDTTPFIALVTDFIGSPHAPLVWDYKVHGYPVRAVRSGL